MSLEKLNNMFDKAQKDTKAKSLGEIVESKREKLGMSQADLARETELSASLISKIEGNRAKDLKVSTVKKLSMALNIDAMTFFLLLATDIKTGVKPGKKTR